MSNNEMRIGQIIALLIKHPYWMHVAISPSGCSECPFSVVSDDNDYEGVNFADPDEGYYQCKLIHKKVWGEDPQCKTEDWLNKIQELLHEMMNSTIQNRQH